ncbi:MULTISPECIES: phosphatase PAP2 family protein [unclassified Lentimicrobium]|uniref:phosphatase PAP2 family protein n=1 Tax=unclassified Lentimicrobium TaxID=2677434 RepID=UPI00155789FD|nr:MULTISPECIES: phosphatase PAP2 family protein [unclassified Lentimicrobium]
MTKLSSNTLLADSSTRGLLYMMIAVLLLSSPILFLPKEQATFWINGLNTPFLDLFFKYITHLGDGLVFIPVFIFLLFRSYVKAGFFAFFVILEALIVQLVLKKGVFAHLDRPMAYIQDFDLLHQVTGVHLHGLHTFPSGHTQSVFLVAFFLVWALKKGPAINLLILSIAVLTGLSRVYILQHFLIDVWFGALIGFGLPFITIYLLQWFGKFPSSEKRLIFWKEVMNGKC